MALAIASITGEVASTNGITVSITGMTVGDYYSIYRTSSTLAFQGFVQELDGTVWDHIQYGSTTKTINDYSAPFGGAIYYWVKRYVSSDLLTHAEQAFSLKIPGSSDSASAMLAKGSAMISDPLSYTTASGYGYVTSVTGTIVDFKTTARRANILGNHKVLGRTNPVIISDGLGGRTGTIIMINISSTAATIGGQARTATYEPIAYDDLYGWPVLFEDGRTLLFRSFQRDTGVPDFYFKTTGVEVTRAFDIVSTQNPNYSMPIIYKIDFEEVDPFIILDVADIAPTWQTVTNNNVGWAEVASTHATWADVLADPTA